MEFFERMRKEVGYLDGVIVRLEQEVEEKKRQKKGLEKMLKRFTPATACQSKN